MKLVYRPETEAVFDWTQQSVAVECGALGREDWT